jgi:hypothetical protein
MSLKLTVVDEVEVHRSIFLPPPCNICSKNDASRGKATPKEPSSNLEYSGLGFPLEQHEEVHVS